MRKVTWVLVPLIVLVGCASAMTPGERFVLAADSYAAVMETLADYRAAGLIDDEAAERVELVRRAARAALDAWGAALKQDDDPAVFSRQFGDALRALLDEQLKAEVRDGRGDGAAAGEDGAADPGPAQPGGRGRGGD